MSIPHPNSIRPHSFLSCTPELSPENGYSLLEVALTLPLLFVLMIGVVDVNTTLQAYHAVRDGVETANRCTWATDGDCNEVSPDTGPGPAYFNWNAYRPGATTYYGYKSQYAGEEYFLTAPRFRFDTFEGHRLDYRSFTTTLHRRQVAQLTFPARAITPQIYEAELPALRIQRVPGGRPNVSATFLDGGGRYQNTLDYQVLNSPSLRWNSQNSGRVRFRIRRPAGIVCRESVNFNRASGHSASEQECGHGVGSGFQPNRVKAILFVTANSGNSPRTANGTVSMTLSGPGISEPIDLGGRRYGGNDDASLCPRVPSLRRRNGLGPWVTQQNCSESTPGRYSGFSALEYDRNYTLTFSFTSGAPDLEWNFEDLQLYLPRITSGDEQWQDCEGGVLRSQYGSNSGCSIGGSAASSSVLEWIDPEAQPENYRQVLREELTDVLIETPHNTIRPASRELIDAVFGRQHSSEELRDWFETPSQSDPNREVRHECDEQNFGQSIREVPEPGQPAEVELSRADSECRANTSLPSHSVHDLRYYTEPVAIAAEPVSWTPENCTDHSSRVLPPAARRFRHVTFNTTYDGQEELDPLGRDRDPREALSSPSYACSVNG
ncbi:hypothetical protein MRY87_09430, partial [bacterium]|nr:hypothetical protein [bacterium]